jgi:hypothetical protein
MFISHLDTGPRVMLLRRSAEIRSEGCAASARYDKTSGLMRFLQGPMARPNRLFASGCPVHALNHVSVYREHGKSIRRRLRRTLWRTSHPWRRQLANQQPALPRVRMA